MALVGNLVLSWTKFTRLNRLMILIQEFGSEDDALAWKHEIMKHATCFNIVCTVHGVEINLQNQPYTQWNVLYNAT
jgi:hypothetical protein